MNEPSDLRVLIPQERSPVAALCGGIAALAAAGLAIAFGLDQGISLSARWTALGAGTVIAASLGAGALRLWSPRGGFFYAPIPGALGIGLTRENDVLWIPKDEISGLSTVCLQEAEDQPVWSLLVCWRGHADWLLLEGTDHEAIRQAMEVFMDQTGLPEVSHDSADDDDLTPPTSDRFTFGVRSGVALQGLLMLFGLALLVIGALLVPQYRAQPVFAIFFGPVLVLLGGTLLVLDLLKRLATESIENEGGLWTHGFHLGGRHWGDRTVSAPHPRWVMRPLGLKGAHLEIVGPRELLVVGSGATTRSHIDVTTLCRLPSGFTRRPGASPPTDRPGAG